MYKQYLYIFGAAFIVCLANCETPPGLNKCKSDDTKCHIEAIKMFLPLFAAGMPEYGVEPLDPLVIKSVNASQGNLLFLLNDVTVKGLKNCDIIDMSRDNVNKKMHLAIKCTATLDGDYVLQGSILTLLIEGNGKIHADLNSAKFNAEIPFEVIVGKDGKEHWSIKSYQYTFDLEEKSNVVFENLFNGNAVLDQAAAELIKNNGNEVIKEIGSPFFKYVMNVVVKDANHFFKAFSIEDLSID